MCVCVRRGESEELGQTFRRRGQGGSLDGVRLQTPFEHVVPELHDAVLSPGHKALNAAQTGSDGHICYTPSEIILLKLQL